MDPNRRFLHPLYHQTAPVAARPIFYSASPFRAPEPVVRLVQPTMATPMHRPQSAAMPCVFQTNSVPFQAAVQRTPAAAAAAAAALYMRSGPHPSQIPNSHPVPVTMAAVQTLTRLTTHVSVQAAARHLVPPQPNAGVRCVMLPLGGQRSPANPLQFSAQQLAGVGLQRPVFQTAQTLLAGPPVHCQVAQAAPGIASFRPGPIIVRRVASASASTSPTPKIVEITEESPPRIVEGMDVVRARPLDADLKSGSVDALATLGTSDDGGPALLAIPRSRSQSAPVVLDASVDGAAASVIAPSAIESTPALISPQSVTTASATTTLTSTLPTPLIIGSGETVFTSSSEKFDPNSLYLEKEARAESGGLKETITDLALQPQLPQSSSSTPESGCTPMDDKLQDSGLELASSAPESHDSNDDLSAQIFHEDKEELKTLGSSVAMTDIAEVGISKDSERPPSDSTRRKAGDVSCSFSENESISFITLSSHRSDNNPKSFDHLTVDNGTLLPLSYVASGTPVEDDPGINNFSAPTSDHVLPVYVVNTVSPTAPSYVAGEANTGPHFCLQCSQIASSTCQKHLQFIVKPSSITSQHIRDTVVPSQARLSIPQCLEIKIVTRMVQSTLFTLNDSREGVWVRNGEETIPAGTLFGPLKGELRSVKITDKKNILSSGLMWKISSDGDHYTFFDCSDEQKSNWMRFVKKFEGDETEGSNLTALLHDSKIFFVASQPLRPGEELCFWFAKDYLAILDHERSSKPPSLKDNEEGMVSSDILDTKSVKKNENMHSVLGCYICKRSFGTKELLLEHIGVDHPQEVMIGEGELVCPICRKTFSKLSVLNKHKRYHMVSKKYKCHTCNICFKQKSHLANHLIMHTKEKRFLCRKCSAFFGRVSDLRSHVKYVHNNDKNFSCRFCFKNFKTLKTLNQHIAKHLSRFCCGQCNKSFSSNYHLKRHQMFSSCLSKVMVRMNNPNKCFVEPIAPKTNKSGNQI